MNIQKVEVKLINSAPYNPRVDLKPGDEEYEKLKKSIQTFGYVEPLVWNKRTGNLVSGHQRFKILLEQGMAEVEVSVVDLSLAQEKALNLALNKIRGEWDENKLADLLAELRGMPDFDMGLTGFTLPEVTDVLDRQKEDEEDNFDVEEDVASIKVPVTQKGDLIQLGKHRILCGDSSSASDVEKLFQGEKAQLLHCDPPYNVNYYGGNRPHGKSRPKKSKHWERIYSDNMTQEDYEKWLSQVFNNMAPFLGEGAPVYVWNGHRQFGPMHAILDKLGFHVATVITWVKPSFSISYADYNNQSEFCLYAWKEDNGAHKWYGPTNESNLWEINRDPAKVCVHPTQKPIAIAQRAIRNSSQRGDTVLDLFLGSGSTLIAAETLERRCFGMELDPKYCDAIVRRYLALVGHENANQELVNKYKKEVENV